MKRWIGLGFVVALAVGASPLSAQEPPQWLQGTELSGQFFTDAYWVAQNHDRAIEGRSGSWVRRIYLTLDHEMSDRLDFRLRFEAASPGDFESSDRIEPFVKDAWVRWRGDRTAVYGGLAPTPTWAVVESFWGYRSVEKTPLDLQRMGSSRDLGLAIRGSFDSERRFRYHAMVGNGSGTRAETNEGKKAMLSLGYHDPTGTFVAEVYGDFEDRSREQRTTIQGFLGLRWDDGRAGLQYAHQERSPDSGPSTDLDLASAFTVVEIGARLNAFARVDRMFDPNPDGDRIAYIPFAPGAESTFALAGLEAILHDSVSLIPNVEAVFYDGGSHKPDTDLIPRLTLSLRF